MGILDSNPAEAGTVQSESTSDLGDKSLADLFAMDEEAFEADPNPVASEEAGERPAKQADNADEPEGDEPDDEEAADAEESDEQKDGKDDEADSDAVEIDGKRYTRDEIRDGLMRQADYTRKTQALATERKEFEGAIGRLQQQDERARADLGFAQQVLQAILPPMPDPATIQSDPIGYMQAKAQREQAEAVIRDLHSRQQGLSRQQQAAIREQTEKALHAEWDSAVKMLPELATPEGKQKFRSEAIEYGKAYDLTPEEIDSVSSAKELAVLKDAIAWRKLQAQKPKAVAAVKATPKIVTRPGTREQPATALSRLQKLGSDPKASAADIFAAMEED